MEILIGLAVAAGVVYGWFRGFVLVAIFLTLGEAFFVLMIQAGAGLAAAGSSVILGLVCVLGVIWTPAIVARNRLL